MVLVLDSVLCIHEETTLAHMLISKTQPEGSDNLPPYRSMQAIKSSSYCYKNDS
jgi:hypothetical protein